MILYIKKVRELLRKFVLVQVRHIPRAENSREDALAKLATASQEDLNKQTPVEHLAEPVQLKQNSPWSLSGPVLKSSTTQLRPGSRGVDLAQAV